MLFIIFAIFQVKHFLIDFVLQPPYEWQNKGTYGHRGGIQHALKHAVGTGLILLMFPSYHSPFIVALAFLDFITHYHIDWAKMNINDHFNFTPNTEYFWVMLGLDQFLHQLTMLAIVGIFVGWA